MEGKRHSTVLATKYSLVTTMPASINEGGNHRKNMVQSVEDSLKRLKTDYIDLLYLHAWDFSTGIEEVMRGLDDLVRAGKVVYLGISDTPAWIVAQGQTIAQFRGYNPFVALQVEYSLIQRTPERDLIPMAEALGLGLLAWAPLAGGALTGRYLTEEAAGRVPEGSIRRNERSTTIAREVVRIAQEFGATPAQVALKWMMQHSFNNIPLVGATKLHQIEDALGACDIHIPIEAMESLNMLTAIEPGFPHDFLAGEAVNKALWGENRAKFITKP
jgi:aryl-alcohol dehydrogenase-like predicted oxidoreductase